MRRAQFIRGSAIVGAAAIIPRFLTAGSGMFEVSGERKVAQILNAKRSMVQNVPVLRAFAGGKNDLVSPFVMLDEFGPLDVDPGTIGMDIQAHPHAGVVPTTYLVKGSGRHTDSMANDIVYHEGQYMLFNSGRGAIHEEVSDDKKHVRIDDSNRSTRAPFDEQRVTCRTVPRRRVRSRVAVFHVKAAVAFSARVSHV